MLLRRVPEPILALNWPIAAPRSPSRKPDDRVPSRPLPEVEQLRHHTPCGANRRCDAIATLHVTTTRRAAPRQLLSTSDGVHAARVSRFLRSPGSPTPLRVPGDRRDMVRSERRRLVLRRGHPPRAKASSPYQVARCSTRRPPRPAGAEFMECRATHPRS